MTPRMHAILFVSLLPLIAAKPVPPRFTPAELDDLLAPIALYPDPLLAQTLPATTTALDLVEAAQWLRDTPAPTEQLIADQSWPAPVRALTHYPKVLRYLADNVAWTRQLGDAYANQRVAVNQSIQRLRAKARLAGSLPNSPEQTIYVQPNNTISIQPAQPDVIYVPVYDPQVIYTHRHPPRFEDPCPTGPLLHPDQPTPPTPQPPATPTITSTATTADAPAPEIRTLEPSRPTFTPPSPAPTPAPNPAPVTPAPQPPTAEVHVAPAPTTPPAAEQTRVELPPRDDHKSSVVR